MSNNDLDVPYLLTCILQQSNISYNLIIESDVTIV